MIKALHWRPGEAGLIAAMLSALILNAVLLQELGTHYALIVHPFPLLLGLMTVAAFAGFSLVYVPARLAATHDEEVEGLVRFYLGTHAAQLVWKVFTPIWAALWFALISSFGINCLEYSLFQRQAAEFGPALFRPMLPGLLWLALVIPWAAVPLARLPFLALLLFKVSLAAILGLMLSSVSYVPDALSWLRNGRANPLPLNASLVLWIAPPLLVCFPLFRPFRYDRRAIFKIVVIGVVLPVIFVVAAALITMAGAAEVNPRFRKGPLYLQYAAARPHQIGWAKILILSLTLLVPARFAANRFAAIICRQAGGLAAFGCTAFLIALTLALQHLYWESRAWQYAWQYAALPFPALAGVLTGVFLATGGSRPIKLSPRTRALLVAAWAIGVLIPTTDQELTAVWVLCGWCGSAVLGYLVVRWSSNNGV